MSTHQFITKSCFPAIAMLLFFQFTDSSAQQLPPEVEQLGYADTIFLNGKIVSMDDASNSAQVGNIYQAIAVKHDKIMKLGTTDEVQALAGRITRVFNLEGRTLIPGIIEPHRHIYGNALRWADRVGFKYPPDGVTFVQAQADRDLEKTQAIIRDTLQEAVKKVNKGDWIVLNMQRNPETPGLLQFWGMTRRLTNRQTLDRWAPENPVLMRPGLRGNINSKALEILDEFLPGYSDSIQETMHGVDIGEDIPSIGWVGSQEMAVITWELFLQNIEPNILAQMLKLESEAPILPHLAAQDIQSPSSRTMPGSTTTNWFPALVPRRRLGHFRLRSSRRTRIIRSSGERAGRSIGLTSSSSTLRFKVLVLRFPLDRRCWPLTWIQPPRRNFPLCS